MTFSEQDRLHRSLAPYRNFTIRYHTLESIARLLIEARTPRIDREIRLVDDQYFERVDGNIRGLIATVQGIDLVDLIKDPDNHSSVLLDIFDENVRVYLTSKNRINSHIIESALSESNAEFWYLNNGITMTCDSISGTRGGVPTVVPGSAAGRGASRGLTPSFCALQTEGWDVGCAHAFSPSWNDGKS